MESVTLKALIDQQKQIGLSDIDIIKTFFVQNDAEEDAIDLSNSVYRYDYSTGVISIAYKG